MTDTYISEFTSDTETLVCYVYKIVQEGSNGWCKCRMVHIHTEYTDGTKKDVIYDPETHDNTGHYMGQFYTARHMYSKNSNRLQIYWGAGEVHYAKS
jgi:hypothetical protein